LKFTNRLEIGEECFEIFLTSDAFPEMPVFGVHMAGIAHLKPPYLVERTDPGIHTLLFTSSGQGKLTTAEGEYDISSETMTVIPAHMDWRFEIACDHWDMCWILLPTTLHWNALMPKTGEIRTTTQAMNIFHLSHVIDQERHLDKHFREHSFAQLARYIEFNLHAELPDQEDRLAAAFAKIEQSLHKPWTVQDIAKLTFYSEPHLFRLCKERFGKSPKQMIRDLRIERAKQLLEHTDWPLAELAARLGFSDQFNFSNRFKKEVGTSPAFYRKQHIQ
jgi:AraC-like DNA-binding protein